MAIEAPVVFNGTGATTSGISHAAPSANITVSAGGTYKVSFATSGTEPGQFALFLDGVVVDGTTYGSGAGTQQNNGQAIVAIPAGAVLTLRNHSSAAAVGLQPNAGGTAPSVNASVVLEKLD
ncbi:MAG TPA: hypothetical protein VEX39_05880 [Thermoleophilaceae bacterium]|nr:hypothetical protein [Thermoleophilaceae bacterium]